MLLCGWLTQPAQYYAQSARAYRCASNRPFNVPRTVLVTAMEEHLIFQPSEKHLIGSGSRGRQPFTDLTFDLTRTHATEIREGRLCSRGRFRSLCPKRRARETQRAGRRDCEVSDSLADHAKCPHLSPDYRFVSPRQEWRFSIPARERLVPLPLREGIAQLASEGMLAKLGEGATAGQTPLQLRLGPCGPNLRILSRKGRGGARTRGAAFIFATPPAPPPAARSARGRARR
jgi:hypothetical protein